VHIILVSNRLAKARTITVTPLAALSALAAFAMLVLLLSSLFSYIAVRHAAEIRLPFVQELVRAVSAEDAARSKEFVRENLKAMAVRLGEMQAQLMRLDSLGDRIAKLTGVKPQELAVPPRPALEGRGGPLVRSGAPSEGELQQALAELSSQLESRSDTLALLESRLFDERVRQNMLPSSLPIEEQWNASGFGWRVDPFTGENAMHEGVDFPAEVGTPIRAAAAGVVVSAAMHPDYGNLIEIDHGNDITTRYAHTSKMMVTPGAIVKRGQIIAEVGTTGRSTGPHLHFEVRYKGIAQNPNRFLLQAQSNTLHLAHSSR
jgi:murein DD-endopeptidase MepM/ murein hydrolase activator NlpD